MSYYYGRPLVNCYLLNAERLVEASDLGDEQRRKEVHRVISTVLGAAQAAQSHLLDMDAERLARRTRRRPAPQPAAVEPGIPPPSPNGALRG